jgi:hypothetical protein
LHEPESEKMRLNILSASSRSISIPKSVLSRKCILVFFLVHHYS